MMQTSVQSTHCTNSRVGTRSSCRLEVCRVVYKALNDPLLTEVEMPTAPRYCTWYQSSTRTSGIRKSECRRLEDKVRWPRNEKGFVDRNSEAYKQWAHNGQTLEDGRMPQR